MKDVNSELQMLTGELQRLKQHNKETKRLIKDIFWRNCGDEIGCYVYKGEYEALVKHVNKRK